MKSALESVNPTRVKMTVEVSYEELKPSLDAAYKTIGQQIQVPGFRKGKVPTRIIDQRVGRGAVLQEAVNEALPQFYGQAVDENNVRPLGQPEVDITEVPAEEGGLGGCTVSGPYVFLGAMDGRQVRVVELDGTGRPVGDPQPFLEDDYGRLRTVVLDPSGALWITTSNRDGIGTPEEDDDRVLRVVPPASGADSPL